MMDGIFVPKKTISWSGLILLCGVYFLGQALFVGITDPAGEMWIHLIFGILCILVSVPALLLNRGAYLQVSETAIRAKYHWFGRLDCSMEDVAFVQPQMNMLTILLKNGKRHTISGVQNSWAVSSAIRRHCFALEQESPDALRRQLIQAQARRKREFWLLLAPAGLLFANIFITVALTGSRELHEFSRSDWTRFSVMVCVELATVVWLFYVAQRCGQMLLPMDHLHHRLQSAVIATQPLPSSRTIAVYTDEDFSGRIVVCGFPKDNGVYYCIQEFGEDFRLETVYTSDVYDQVEDLPGKPFETLMELKSLPQA